MNVNENETAPGVTEDGDLRFGYAPVRREAFFRAKGSPSVSMVHAESMKTASSGAIASLLLIMHRDFREGNGREIFLVCYGDTPLADCRELALRDFRKILGYLREYRPDTLRDIAEFITEYGEPRDTAESFMKEEAFRPYFEGLNQD